jgi:hypothetical protein
MKQLHHVVLAFLVVALTPLGAEAAGGKGMTWKKLQHDATLGTDLIGCHAQPSCEPYQGDTACTVQLPVLCIKQDGSPNPGTPVNGVYRQWAKGHVATTPPVRGDSLGSRALADGLCLALFGPGWRMAEFHDGSGWSFDAYGDVRDDSRLWVAINDQKANCWN